MATPPDLTPFGYTKTETIVYDRLLKGGPASGYAIARDLVIARANAYQALRGLVAKGAAVAFDGQPQRFRAVRPVDLFAGIVEQQTRQLDDLEGQLARDQDATAESFIRLSGERAFVELAARTAVRETAEVRFLGTAKMLVSLTPSFRKRAVDGARTLVWVLGEGAIPSDSLEGTVPLQRSQELFGAPIAILLAGSSVMLRRMVERGTTGYWASDPDIVGATRGAFQSLTGKPA